MALGKVEITNTVITDPQTQGVIGKVLFIGVIGSGASATAGAVQTLSSTFDADAKFGSSSELAKQIKVAYANNPKLQGWAIAAASGKTWKDVIDTALQTANPELIAICDELADKAAIQAVQSKATTLEGIGKRVIFLTAVAKNLSSQTISAYITASKAKVQNLSANRVVVFAKLFGNEIGAMAGRISKMKVQQPPMRVKSGALAQIGELQADSAGATIQKTDLETLDTASFSVMQWYENMSGFFPADVNLFDTTINKLEYRRTLDKATRALEQVAIREIGDSVKNTPVGNSAFINRLSKPLREMALAEEIEPLAADAVKLTWVNATKVQIHFQIRPFKTPKDIAISLTLDTTTHQPSS